MWFVIGEAILRWPGCMTKLATSKAREFSLSEAEYKSIRDRAYSLAGIKLGDQKQDLVYSRLTKRIRALGLADFASYLRFLDHPQGQQEVEQMLNALTTNLTSFFREAHHFEHLTAEALNSRLDQQKGPSKRLRIWSSACSTGEEPYSIAMALMQSGIDLSHIDTRILATDLNTDVLQSASQGRYNATISAKCPVAYQTYFQPHSSSINEIKPAVRDLIRFRQLNLLGNWPMKGQFDVIFCRNVLIYFDNETKNRLVSRFINILKPNGWLYLGHSESASGNHPSLISSGRTIYRKTS